MTYQILGKQLKAIASVASSGEGRLKLQNVWCDTAPSGNARLWATDGRMLIAKEFLIEGPEIPIPYELASIKRLRAKDIFDVGPKGLTCGDGVVHLSVWDAEDREPPAVDKVIPEYHPDPKLAPGVLGLNPDLMAKGMKAIYNLAEEGRSGARFQFDKGMLGPLLVTVLESLVTFVIMPYRIGKEMTVDEILEERENAAEAA